MCGRYILAEPLEFARVAALAENHWQFEVSYNVAPTDAVPVVRMKDGQRIGVMMRWGLIPFFAHGVAPKYSTINAQVERIQTGPAWKGPWSRGQRCLQWAAGFYEWNLNAQGQKHPFFVSLADRSVFAFASVWDRSFTAEGARIDSCALITVPGNELLKRIHNTGAHPYRMPAILAPSDWEAWLEGSAGQAKAVLKPYPDRLMVAHPVSHRVNDPKNDGPELIEAV